MKLLIADMENKKYFVDKSNVSLKSSEENSQSIQTFSSHQESKKSKQSEEKRKSKKSRKISRMVLNFCRYVGLGVANSAPIVLYYPEVPCRGQFTDHSGNKFRDSFCRTACTLSFP
ncbi:uncharacterized protein LOC111624706 [Centruroides sculpturatus]|uniref:uncharacterized protein LOC111624706 n=1 Tax=Centruroides sculpturatus TaxID=218467 RepID=UPI000C6E5A97|nr:uncharacterized protein LOC111624706 [Centruroides sculpturatus]